MARLAFNGRFLTQRPVGVQRVAREMVCAFDRLLREDVMLAHHLKTQLICPVGADTDLDLAEIQIREHGRWGGQAWEQFSLPGAVKDQLLVSLCNLAPLNVRHGMTMIHDAQVFSTPQSYSRAFRAWYRYAQPRIGQKQKTILTVSEYSRQELIRFNVAPAEKIRVIHNGADHVLRTPADPAVLGRLGLARGEYSLGLANTQAHKNLGVVLRAMQSDRLVDHKLVLFGAADAAAFAAAGHPVSDRIVFAGYVEQAELRALMEAALALVFPSRTEGFGLPPLEAMTFGTPVIAAPCGALPEVCGDAAIYADPDSVEAWTNALVELATGGVAKHEARRAAARAQAAKFTWDGAARQLLEEVLALDPLPISGSAE